MSTGKFDPADTERGRHEEEAEYEEDEYEEDVEVLKVLRKVVEGGRTAYSADELRMRRKMQVIDDNEFDLYLDIEVQGVPYRLTLERAT